MPDPQSTRRGRLFIAVQAGALILTCVLVSAKPSFAEGPAGAPISALTGRVTSGNEGAMEGVLVSAQRDGSPISVTVVTGADGRYVFPADRVSPGEYALRIRAIGYELGGPAGAAVSAGTTTTADLALRKIDDISSQLTSTEWLISMPGTAEQKRPLIECMSCHTLERVVRSTLHGRRIRWRAQADGELRQQFHNAARAGARRRTRGAGRPRAPGGGIFGLGEFK